MAGNLRIYRRPSAQPCAHAWFLTGRAARPQHLQPQPSTGCCKTFPSACSPSGFPGSRYPTATACPQMFGTSFPSLWAAGGPRNRKRQPSLRLVSLNVDGLRSKVTRRTLFNLLHWDRRDIVQLQDTHHCCLAQSEE